jgi:hypothetical protein
LRACCIPQPRPGFLRPGVSPVPQPTWLVARPCPLAVIRPYAHRHAGCHIRAPRPRGFDPWTDAFLRVGV